MGDALGFAFGAVWAWALAAARQRRGLPAGDLRRQERQATVVDEFPAYDVARGDKGG